MKRRGFLQLLGAAPAIAAVPALAKAPAVQVVTDDTVAARACLEHVLVTYQPTFGKWIVHVTVDASMPSERYWWVRLHKKPTEAEVEAIRQHALRAILRLRRYGAV